MSFNTVKVIQDSVNTSGNRLITYEIETYRYIWAEVLTHKMLNKNAQSSRAVPVKSVLSINESDPVTPIVWGKNQGAMQLDLAGAIQEKLAFNKTREDHQIENRMKDNGKAY